jgi:hypothetical protein
VVVYTNIFYLRPGFRISSGRNRRCQRNGGGLHITGKRRDCRISESR